MTIKIKIGKFGQQLAGQFLQKRNYKILVENYFTRLGEIDIIAQRDEQLVFIEVKTRLSDKYGLPEEAVTKAKKEKIINAALIYLEENLVDHDNWRIDCLAIEIDKHNKKALIRHHKAI